MQLTRQHQERFAVDDELRRGAPLLETRRRLILPGEGLRRNKANTHGQDETGQRAKMDSHGGWEYTTRGSATRLYRVGATARAVECLLNELDHPLPDIVSMPRLGRWTPERSAGQRDLRPTRRQSSRSLTLIRTVAQGRGEGVPFISP